MPSTNGDNNAPPTTSESEQLDLERTPEHSMMASQAPLLPFSTANTMASRSQLLCVSTTNGWMSDTPRLPFPTANTMAFHTQLQSAFMTNALIPDTPLLPLPTANMMSFRSQLLNSSMTNTSVSGSQLLSASMANGLPFSLSDFSTELARGVDGTFGIDASSHCLDEKACAKESQARTRHVSRQNAMIQKQCVAKNNAERRSSKTKKRKSKNPEDGIAKSLPEPQRKKRNKRPDGVIGVDGTWYAKVLFDEKRKYHLSFLCSGVSFQRQGFCSPALAKWEMEQYASSVGVELPAKYIVFGGDKDKFHAAIQKEFEAGVTFDPYSDFESFKSQYKPRFQSNGVNGVDGTLYPKIKFDEERKYHFNFMCSGVRLQRRGFCSPALATWEYEQYACSIDLELPAECIVFGGDKDKFHTAIQKEFEAGVTFDSYSDFESFKSQYKPRCQFGVNGVDGTWYPKVKFYKQKKYHYQFIHCGVNFQQQGFCSPALATWEYEQHAIALNLELPAECIVFGDDKDKFHAVIQKEFEAGVSFDAYSDFESFKSQYKPRFQIGVNGLDGTLYPKIHFDEERKYQYQFWVSGIRLKRQGFCSPALATWEYEQHACTMDLELPPEWVVFGGDEHKFHSTIQKEFEAGVSFDSYSDFESFKSQYKYPYCFRTRQPRQPRRLEEVSKNDLNAVQSLHEKNTKQMAPREAVLCLLRSEKQFYSEVQIEEKPFLKRALALIDNKAEGWGIVEDFVKDMRLLRDTVINEIKGGAKHTVSEEFCNHLKELSQKKDGAANLERINANSETTEKATLIAFVEMECVVLIGLVRGDVVPAERDNGYLALWTKCTDVIEGWRCVGTMKKYNKRRKYRYEMKSCLYVEIGLFEFVTYDDGVATLLTQSPKRAAKAAEEEAETGKPFVSSDSGFNVDEEQEELNQDSQKGGGRKIGSFTVSVMVRDLDSENSEFERRPVAVHHLGFRTMTDNKENYFAQSQKWLKERGRVSTTFQWLKPKDDCYKKHKEDLKRLGIDLSNWEGFCRTDIDHNRGYHGNGYLSGNLMDHSSNSYNHHNRKEHGSWLNPYCKDLEYSQSTVDRACPKEVVNVHKNFMLQDERRKEQWWP